MQLERPLPPGSTIGILGGGQLGRMLVLAAARIGEARDDLAVARGLLLAGREGAASATVAVAGERPAVCVGGALGLVYGGFSYTKDSHGTQVGPIVLKVEEKQTVMVPIFISLGAMALGAFLVLGLRSK